MLSPVEKLNQALRDNRPEEYLSTLHRELGLRAIAFRPGESVWEWDATQERVLNPVWLCLRRVFDRLCR